MCFNVLDVWVKADIDTKREMISSFHNNITTSFQSYFLSSFIRMEFETVKVSSIITSFGVIRMVDIRYWLEIVGCGKIFNHVYAEDIFWVAKPKITQQYPFIRWNVMLRKWFHFQQMLNVKFYL